jgi:hypothetical protein
MELRALNYFVRKPVRLWWLLLPLMGFESVVSERPLTPTNEGFIDRDVIGDWALATDTQRKLVLSIARAESGMLEVRAHDHAEAGVPYLRYRAYSSRLGEDTYANLELVGYGCVDCSGAQLPIIRAEVFDPLSQIVGRTGSTCKFILVKYEHTADDRLIVYSYGDSDFVKHAVEQQRLAGRVFGANAGDLAGEPCITDTAEKLREFYSQNAATLFPEAGAEEFVRAHGAAAPR